MTRASVGGRLDHEAMRMLHFHTLTHDEQRRAVHRMADSGQSELAIAAATGWSREYVLHVLRERAPT